MAVSMRLSKSSTGMARASFLLAVLLLASFLMDSLAAAHLSRNRKIFEGAQGLPALGDTQQMISKEGRVEELTIRGRVDLASNDYPGPDYNHKHTPPIPPP